ncbi:MAG: hypothetical protein G01um101466_232 [Parcubacteria group bacterium Gr01-1014_66]|nr:MAG: hypothetical protein G01um101466_232 [Parcubacteria group bacterium Gr01-1014_66]
MLIYQDSSPTTKKYIRALSMLLLLGVTASAMMFAFSYGVSAWHEWRRGDPIRQLPIQGEGKVLVKPDIARFTVSVVTQAQKVKNAQSENSTRSNKIMAFLKKERVEEKDIETISYNINPQYQYDRDVPCFSGSCPPVRPPQIVGYEVRHTLEVKVRALDNVDTLLDGVITDGANEVGTVSFYVDNDDVLKQEARRKAVDDAEKKAKELAKILGVRLGRLVSFSENGGFPLPVLYREAFGKGGGGNFDASPQLEVAPGEHEIQWQVTLVYEFR